jgi:hypothetical protein
MKPKDFALLMIMPLILIGIVIYTDLKPDITGFVTHDSQQSNILGTYSIMPSFRVKTDYNVNEEYRNLKQTLQNVITECKIQRNIETCLNRKASELQWVCEQNENTAVLYDFIDKLNDCINLENQSVVCKFSLDQRNFDNEREFEIRLTDLTHRVKAELIENNRILATHYLNLEDLLYTGYPNRDSESKTIETIKIIVEFNDRKPTVKSAFTIDEATRIDLSKTFLIYKSAEKIKFIDAAEEDSFRAPEPANTIIELPRTRGIKFCVTSNKQTNAYDVADNQVRPRPIVYKFAVTFPKPEEIQENNQEQQTN